MFLKLMYITNNPEVALIAEKNGVDRIWIDLETLGKEERQKDMDTVKSEHTIEDIKKIKPLLKKSEMLVRINPWNENSIEEINDVIDAGADIIMLPMWKDVCTVEKFLECVNNRVKTTLLLETKEAAECVDDILKMGGFNEIHIGLNDLHLSYGKKFMFELLSNGVVENLCNKFKKYKLSYGFGGIAKIGEGMLPAEKIIMEHFRLDSTRAILSRSFCDNVSMNNLNEFEKEFEKSMLELSKFESSLSKLEEKDFEKNRIEVQEDVKKIVEKIERR